MTRPVVDRLAVLQAVRLKGRADNAAIAAAIGCSESEASATTAELIDAGLLRAVGTAVKPTEEGREELARLLTLERAALDVAAMRELYDRFCPVNDDFKTLMRDWQMVGDVGNDHTDADYDAAIVARLAQIHAVVTAEVQRAATQVTRLARYGARLGSALDRVEAGDHSWISKPIIDSYHTVWFELHEELIGAAGLTRHEEAASGRAS